MKRKPHSRRKRTTTKSVLRLPDLEHAKVAVLNSLTSLETQRGYRHAIDEFVDWYCSEPRLALQQNSGAALSVSSRIPSTCTWHRLPIAAIISHYFGRTGVMIWFGIAALPVIYIHGIWLPRHGVNAWTGEPREKYYALRGWPPADR
jgi:hypothetical protein